jgi:histidine triad (HIT) family protein
MSCLPGVRLAETYTVVALRHPRPDYRTHILIVPKRPIPSLLDLRPDDARLLSDMIAIAQQLVHELGMEAGYRLIINGSAYQDVGQLHVHLVAGARGGGGEGTGAGA